MKLMYQDSILEFEVLRDKVTVVSFENRKVFRRMVTELDIQCDSGVGPWILNDNDKAFNLDKYSHIILNPLYVDVNSKSLLTKLQNQLTKEALLMTEEVADIVNRLHAFYYSLEFGYPLSIQHKMEMGVAEIIKLGSFNFEFNRKGDVMDLMSYIEVVDTLLSPMIFIIVNLDLVLNDDEINAFYQNMLSRQLRLVCFTTGSFNREALDKSLINRYILDNDFCII
ncbi:MAG: type II-A CRISPR-associated protein Csn2 [Veillonella sp.]|uniref:type II-A CRISPR-associated protein Csn2 n=1 Tax=Veillonella sp. TaxID=1926307 RepID=UPI00290D51D0|nr:type II-A CRISPR-associated protein Csn2 [Veillonella sp.]MDU4399073.1 type II-A CRISPR-associated protein Csn2 [Veillonella sp.]